jgi:hypothetical protein
LVAGSRHVTATNRASNGDGRTGDFTVFSPTIGCNLHYDDKWHRRANTNGGISPSVGKQLIQLLPVTGSGCFKEIDPYGSAHTAAAAPMHGELKSLGRGEGCVQGPKLERVVA